MRLYIVRHGEAERQVTTDEARALTRDGRDDVTRLWTHLVARGVQPRRIVSSPYVRARQTADLIAGFFPGVPREQLDLITPDGDPSRVLARLLEAGVGDDWVLVSHMPLVDRLCGALTDGGRYPFPVGATACLDVEVLAPEGGRLRWLVAPADIPGTA